MFAVSISLRLSRMQCLIVSFEMLIFIKYIL